MCAEIEKSLKNLIKHIIKMLTKTTNLIKKKR